MITRKAVTEIPMRQVKAFAVLPERPLSRMRKISPVAKLPTAENNRITITALIMLVTPAVFSAVYGTIDCKTMVTPVFDRARTPS